MLKPNTTYKINSVLINEKIIPDNTVWKDKNKAVKAGFSQGEKYKRCHKLSNGTGKVQGVTIHNTDDLTNVDDDAEQYTRATYNENMGSVRVHYYVDEKGAWQNLKAGTGLSANDPKGSAEVGWHSGDGNTGMGNGTTISIECIMKNGTAKDDLTAEDNTARLAAYLLAQNNLSIEQLYTHTYFINKSQGINGSVDTMNTYKIPGIYKYCPLYILPHWAEFKAKVKKYMEEFSQTETDNNQESDQASTNESLKVGDIVAFIGTEHFTSSYKTAIKKSCKPGKATVTKIVEKPNALQTHPIHLKATNNSTSNVNGWVNTQDIKTDSPNDSTPLIPYLIKVTANSLNIRKGPGTNYAVVGNIKDKGVYTIIEERAGTGAKLWGKLKSGAGYISLDFVQKI